MCVDPVQWRARTKFSKLPCAWILCRLCCGVWGRWVFKVPLGVDSVLWCVRTLWVYKFHLYVRLVLWCFQSLSQYWRDCFFQTKVLTGIIHLCWRDCFLGSKISIGIFPCVDLCRNFLWPPLKGTVSPYVVENVSPWGGYTVLCKKLSV